MEMLTLKPFRFITKELMIKAINAFDKSVKNASLTYFSNFDNKTGTFVYEIF